MQEIEDGAVQGRVVENGVAQSVFREDGVTHIRLTHMPGQLLPRTSYGGVVTYPLPQPVTVPAGEMVQVELDWLPEPQQEQAARPVRMPSQAVLTSVSVWADRQSGEGMCGLG